MKKFLSATIAILIVITAALASPAGDAAAYLTRTVTEPTVSSVGGEWTVIALARGGMNTNDDYFQKYYSAVQSYVREKSGVLNIGCEGEMLTGSFVTFVVVYFTHSYFLGILAGGAGGLLTAMIISFLSITRKQDQSVVGIVVNIFAAGFTSFIYRVIFGTSGSGLSIDVMSNIKIPVLGDIPFIGNVCFNQTIW